MSAKAGESILMVRGLTPAMKRQLKKVAKKSGHGTMSSFIRELVIREIQKKKEEGINGRG